MLILTGRISGREIQRATSTAERFQRSYYGWQTTAATTKRPIFQRLLAAGEQTSNSSRTVGRVHRKTPVPERPGGARFLQRRRRRQVRQRAG